MKTKEMETLLHGIKEKYERIKQMTETLDLEADPLTCIGVIEQRAQLLSAIEKEKSMLEQSAAPWRELCERNLSLKKIRSEIQLLIATVIALDSVTGQKLAGKINAVRAEIVSLSQTSKAAISYTRHKKSG